MADAPLAAEDRSADYWRAGCECGRVGLCYRCRAADAIQRLTDSNTVLQGVATTQRTELERIRATERSYIESTDKVLANAERLLDERAKEIEQLRLDLAQQAMNGQTVMEQQKELEKGERALAETHDAWTAETTLRMQAEVERDHAIEDVARLADVLRLARNTQGGRFGHDWPYVANKINEVLRPTPPDVTGNADG